MNDVVDFVGEELDSGVAELESGIKDIETGLKDITGITAQEKALKEQRRAQQLQRRQADIRAARQRIATVRESRIKRAQVQASAEAQGVGTSSGVTGGLGSLQAQTASQLSFMSQVQALGQQANTALDLAAKFQGRSATQSAIFQYGLQAASMFGSRGGGTPAPTKEKVLV